MLHGIDFASGKMLWSVDTRKVFEAPKGYFGVASSPVVDGNRVLVNVGGKKPARHRRVRRRERKDAVDGDVGRAELLGADRRRHRRPAHRRVLHAHRPRRRRSRDRQGPLSTPLARAQAASVNAATPIVTGDRIFLSASYGTGAVLLQVANNAVKPIWSGDESMSNHYSTSVLKDGYLYGFDGRQEFGQTLALRRAGHRQGDVERRRLRRRHAAHRRRHARDHARIRRAGARAGVAEGVPVQRARAADQGRGARLPGARQRPLLCPQRTSTECVRSHRTGSQATGSQAVRSDRQSGRR